MWRLATFWFLAVLEEAEIGRYLFARRFQAPNVLSTYWERLLEALSGGISWPQQPKIPHLSTSQWHHVTKLHHLCLQLKHRYSHVGKTKSCRRRKRRWKAGRIIGRCRHCVALEHVTILLPKTWILSESLLILMYVAFEVKRFLH